MDIFKDKKLAQTLTLIKACMGYILLFFVIRYFNVKGYTVKEEVVRDDEEDYE